METEYCSESRMGSKTSRGGPEWSGGKMCFGIVLEEFCCFVFQKSCSGNILGIGRNKSRSSYFSVTEPESKGETEKGHEWATPHGGAGPPQAAPAYGVGPPGADSRWFSETLTLYPDYK